MLSMENINLTQEFKNFIESVGKGCQMITSEIINNQIHVWCLANSKNDIVFKIILNDKECVELVNSYNLYSKAEITEKYKEFLSNIKSNIINL